MPTVSDDLPEKPEAAPRERLTSIDALRGFDMFWIVGGDAARAGALQMVGHAARPCELRRAVRARRVGRVPVLRPDLPAVPVPGRRGPAVLAAEVHDGRASQEPRLAADRAAGRAAVPAGLDLQRPAAVPLRRPADHRGLAADRHLLRDRRADLPVHEGPHPGDPVRRDPGGLLGDPDVRAVARDEGAGDLAKETNLAGYLDRHYLPGKIYKAITATATTRGCSRRSRRSPRRCWACWPGTGCSRTAIAGSRRSAWRSAGAACLGLGFLWGREFPIIKILWTSSFVLVAGGWSLLLLALFYTVIDVLKLRAWAFFFVVIGVNAITIYIAQGHHPLRRDLEVLPRRRGPAFGLVRPGGRADRRARDRVAVPAPPVSEPDLPEGLRGGGI